MRPHLSRRHLSPFALAVVAIASLHCGAGGLCPELKGGGAASAHFTDEAEANVTLRAFIEASGDLAALADKVEAEVSSACLGMGHDLGVPDAEMKPKDGAGGKVSGACTPVHAKIDAILKAAGVARLQATITPPQCTVSASAGAECKGRCEVTVDDGYLIAHCEPGKLSGTCEGSCEGKCEGTCNGTCEGKCSATNAKGECAGTCEGTCRGHCDATCHASCKGEWKAPKCAVEVKPPSASADCQASCKAHAEMTAQCTDASVKVHVSSSAGELAKLVATFEAHLPVLIKAEIAYGKRLAGDIAVLVHVAEKLPSAMAKAGLHAAACVSAAAQATVHAQASIHVSVEASASVSGKAGG